MDVYLDKNGNAKITEIWDASLNQGTEGYRPYTNLGNSKITNFSVSDEDGTTYEFLEKWNTKANFNTKAYKCGFNKISGGVELCWGISKYGERTYILKYDITNFVVNYSDYQGIYFNFLNLDQSIGGATIKIHSDVPFSIDNSKIWAFGYEGTINFVDGDIILDSNGLLGSYEYMVALVKFENNLFNTTNTSDKTFDTIKESAFSDVDDLEYKNSTKNNNSKKDKLYNAFMIFCYLFFTPLGWFMLYGILVLLKGKEWVLGSERYSGELVFGEEGKKLPKDADINYFREIPCNKDLERAYFICKTYSVEVDSTIKEGIIGAIFLKWIRDKKVNVSKTKRGLFNLKDNDYAIDFSRMENAENEIEEELFQMLLSAAGSNKILEAKEFKKWSKNNCLKISKWFDKIISKEEKYLENEGLIVENTEETAAMFGRKKMITVKNVDPKLKEEAIKLKGLKKFLLDFSMMQKENILKYIFGKNI